MKKFFKKLVGKEGKEQKRGEEEERKGPVAAEEPKAAAETYQF